MARFAREQGLRRIVVFAENNIFGRGLANVFSNQFESKSRKIIKTVMRGQATLAHQVPDVPTVGYDAGIKRLSYDPAKAKELLKAAGYPDGFEITIAGPNDRYINDAQVAQAVAQMWARIGIPTEIDAVTASTFFSRRNNFEFYTGQLTEEVSRQLDMAAGTLLQDLTFRTPAGFGAIGALLIGLAKGMRGKDILAAIIDGKLK